MAEDGGTTFVDLADLVDSSAWPPAASKAAFGTFSRITLITSKICCWFSSLFLHCTLYGTVTTGHWAPEEKLLSTTTTGFKSNTMEAKGPSHSQHKKKQSCDSAAAAAAEWADNGYI